MKLPVVSGPSVVKAFQKLGYVVDRQSGSHIVLRRADPPHGRLVVPNDKAVARGTLRTLIKEAGLEVEDFVALL